jgi:U4/U6.U5 tri-snRNP-associated protein 2
LQGELEVIKEIQNGEGISGDTTRETSRMPFLMLGLDLPPPPLFKDVMEKNIIPQVIVQSNHILIACFVYGLLFSFYGFSACVCVSKCLILQVPLFNILKKFDGESVTEVVRPQLARMRYRVMKLPQYMILHMRRFTKNNFFVEKNPTLGRCT